MNPANVTMFLGRLLHGPTEDRPFAQVELDALQAYLIITAILEPHDPPSVAGLPTKIISNAHAAWLTKLSGYPRVAHIEDCEDVASGQRYKRLWLLSDWLSTTEARQERAAFYNARSAEFIDMRIRFYRVWHLFRRQGLGQVAAQELLESLYEGYRLQIAETLALLRGFGFNNEITREERDDFEITKTRQAGHTYATPTDFHGFDVDDEAE